MPTNYTERHRHLLAEQLKVLNRHIPIILAGNALTAAMVSLIFWEKADDLLISVWMFLILLMIGGRIIAVRQYRHQQNVTENISRWALMFTTGSAISGILWGLGGILFFSPEQPDYQFFLLFILGSMASAGMASLSIHLPTFYWYFIPSLLPITILIFLQGDMMHTVTGLLILVYITVIIRFSRNINDSLMESLTLRFKLAEQKEQAILANIAKSKFLAAASHDLRQPLHALSLFIGALNGYIRYPEVRSIVDNINDSLAALESMFNALLDISKLDAGVIKAEITDFPIAKLTDRLAVEYTPQAKEKNLHWRYVSNNSIIRSDPALLERILRNLISNAIRYTPQGSILLGCRRHDNSLSIEIWDTGLGIAQQQQQNIFQEFHQLDNPERDRNKGLGLGLAIVARLADILGHKITVNSQPGKGSCFRLEVPLGDADNLPSAHDNTSIPTFNTTIPLFVVVIEDERNIREGMNLLLERWGHEVISADSAAEAAILLQSITKPPDIIIADYRLREGKNGISAIDKLRQQFNHAAEGLIITGDVSPEVLQHTKHSGYPLLHKPVQPAQLRAFFGNVARRKQ